MVATTDGLTARVSSESLDVSVTLNGTSTLNNAGQSRTLGVKGGGADFNLSPQVSLAGKVSIGFDTVTTGSLGNATAGFLSELRSGGAANIQSGNLSKAQDIVGAAISQVSSLRGRLGAFSKNVIGSTVNSLNVAYENVAAAESAVRDTDFAAEVASMTRAKILQEASVQAMSLANESPRLFLKLLG
jgi:flagellin